MTCDRRSCRSTSPVFRAQCPLCKKLYTRCVQCGGERSLARSLVQHTVMYHRDTEHPMGRNR